MNRLAHWLDLIDETAGGFIRLAYLAAGITAVAVYFGAGHLPSAVEASLNAALPWALAAAVETHTYITARRVRAAWQDRQASPVGSTEAVRASGALKVNLGVLAGLLLFSCWNQLNYLAATWAPPVTALALPGWMAYVVRALVVPAAFMAAAFLAPLAEPITAQIEAEARATLADVFKIARRQRRRMLVTAERAGRDMTGALVNLVQDPETRRIISHAYAAISPVAPAPGATLQSLIIQPLEYEASAGQYTALQEGPQHAGMLTSPDMWSEPNSASDDHPTQPDRPPTGPGSPSIRPVRTPAPKTARPGTIRLVPEKQPRKVAARGRVHPKQSVEAKVRAAYVPGMSVGELERASGVSRSSANRWRIVLERELQAQQAAQ